MNQEEKTLDECCSFEHKWKIARGHISKSIRRKRLKFSPRESTTTITLCAKFNRNLRCRVLFRDFFGRSVVECPSWITYVTVFWKFWKFWILGSIFPKKSIFWYFRGRKPKILKNRDSHLVELLILRLLVFPVCIFIKKLRLPQTREVWPIFDQKWRVVTSQNRPYLKKSMDFNKIFTDDVKLLCEKACQVSRR